MRKPYFALLPTSLLLLASCGSEPARRAAQSQAAPVAVRVADVTTVDWHASYEATGTVRARTTATISSKVMGYVQQVSAQVGDHVAAGQTLVTLDARDLEAALRQAEAGRASVESAIPELENAVASAKANLDLAQATFKRMEELTAKKSVSNQEFDEASARLKSAQANYDMTRSRRTQVNSKMAQAEQEVRTAAIMRDYAKLAAPFVGVVTARSVEPGNLAAPGAPLLSIEQDGLYRLEASVDESKLPSVRVGQAVDAVIEDRRVSARVSEIVPSVDSASRTYTVKLDLPAMPHLRSGMFGRAFFPLGAQKVAVVPLTALVNNGQLEWVFVVEGGVAHTRMVTTGRRGGDIVEILSGLTVGEKVAAVFVLGLEDGVRVEARP